MNATMSLRQQLTKLLTWSDAHINFDDAVAGLPVAARGKAPKACRTRRGSSSSTCDSHKPIFWSSA